ncbi:hypothetical protein BGZ99_004883 [Dissophora globulifera]|uniref:Copper transport protein n=1 Tax=Dissophora globulifera TaxID=979702 RepID=A0A9P6RGP4_9FUNG|nr:hypothetical protein BGZ99_004883 [Dissophora globulifera]
MLQYAQAQSVDCLVTPSDPSCVAFELPAATTKAALDDLCAQMPYMPGCSLYKSCQASSKTDQWCMPFSILADICAVDMPGMQGCQSYVSLCGPGGSTNKTMVSRPAVCDKSPMIASFPTTKNASALVIDICTEMDMAGCERCPKPPPGAYAADCDTLSTYAILCKAMPDMHQCASWKSMCSPTSDTSSLNFQSSEYCTAGVGSPDMNPPAMRMYFHTGFADYVLFEKWVPRNQGQFVGTWFALFFLTLLFQAIQTYHNGLEGLWAEELARHADDASKTNSSVSLMGLDTNSDARSSSILLHWIHIWRQPWTLKEGKQNVIRALLTFVETTLGYSLMLVTMTFNVGLFFAVIAGFTVGSVMFSRQKSVAIVKSSAVASSGTGCAGCG